MSMGGMRSRRPRSGRRKVAMVFVGLALIGAGLLVFRYAGDIAVQISGFIGPPPDSGDVSGLGATPAGYLPYLVWGFGFTLIGVGGAMLRSALMSSLMGAASGGGMMTAGMGMSPEMMEGVMQQALSATRGAAAPSGTMSAAAKEIVKVKCRNCGSLESEDAAFCRKCGKPL